MNTVADYRRCAEAGMTFAEAAAEIGISENCVRVMAHKYGLAFKLKGPHAARRWQECADAGMTAREAAERLGRRINAAYYQTRANGIKFAPSRKPKPKPSPRVDVLAELGPKEAEDYRFLTKRHQYTRADALRAIGRADLVEA